MIDIIYVLLLFIHSIFIINIYYAYIGVANKWSYSQK